MRLRNSVIIVAVVTVAPAAAHRFDIPAGKLANALSIISSTSGASVGTLSPTLLSSRVDAIHMSGSVPEVLHRLLGDDVEIRRIDEHCWLIVGSRRMIPTVRSIRASADETILVTGSKLRAQLMSYPASVTIVDGPDLGLSVGHKGSDALVERLPILSGTHIGPGQDKLFLRGIADSSVVGSRPATVGAYYGDLRLTYTAPDPYLLPYDMRSIEVMSGPQGTLYGAGALGGLIRLQPAPPDFSGTSGSAWVGLGTTAHGAASTDEGAIMNLPLIDDRLAARGVAYHVSQGGYIDDPELGRSNVNQVTITGGRLVTRLRLGDWTLDLGGVGQSIRSDDAQYAERDVGPLARRSGIAQPSSDDIRLANIVLQRSWDNVHLSSTAGWILQDIHQTNDATPAGGAVRTYQGDGQIRLISNDTHVARSAGTGLDWLIGFSAISSHVEQYQRLGGQTRAVESSQVLSHDIELNGYGELIWHPEKRVLIAAGLRYVHASLDGLAFGQGVHNFVFNGPKQHVSRSEQRVLPSLSASIRADDSLTLFARYEEGFRPGGVAAGTTTYHFDSDRLHMVETGWRYRSDGGALHLDGALAYSRWNNIQADLLSVGLPVTANIGDGRILSFDAQGGWRMSGHVSLNAALMLASSRVKLAPIVGAGSTAVLPDVPDVSARADVTYALPLANAHRLRLDLSGRYVGVSKVGQGAALDLLQGDYALFDASARLELGRYGLSLSADNLLDSHRNSFALGAPFTAEIGQQITPLRPRTFRIGIEAAI